MNLRRYTRIAHSLGGLAMLSLAGVGCSHNSGCVRAGGMDAAGFASSSSFAPVIRAQSADGVRSAAHRTSSTQGKNIRLVTHEGSSVDPSTGLPAGSYVAGPNAPVTGGMTYENCPPQYAGGNCPPGYGACPPYASGPCPMVGHTYSYRDPGVPVYPAGTGPNLTGPGSPGAIVQYPYYTTKGPDDFFLDEDGRY